MASWPPLVRPTRRPWPLRHEPGRTSRPRRARARHPSTRLRSTGPDGVHGPPPTRRSRQDGRGSLDAWWPGPMPERQTTSGDVGSGHVPSFPSPPARPTPPGAAHRRPCPQRWRPTRGSDRPSASPSRRRPSAPPGRAVPVGRSALVAGHRCRSATAGARRAMATVRVAPALSQARLRAGDCRPMPLRRAPAVVASGSSRRGRR